MVTTIYYVPVYKKQKHPGQRKCGLENSAVNPVANFQAFVNDKLPAKNDFQVGFTRNINSLKKIKQLSISSFRLLTKLKESKVNAKKNCLVMNGLAGNASKNSVS